MKTYSSIFESAIAFAKEKLEAFDGGHDWFHTERVLNNARAIWREEQQGDLQVIELAAVLHDIADTKFGSSSEDEGGELAYTFLLDKGLDRDKADRIRDIINSISFRKHKEVSGEQSIEFCIVQDADRLDAIGAIGIARAFNYGGYKQRPLYDPDIPPVDFSDRESYKKSTAPTINHFYEKLFLLKDMMHTDAAKKIASERHDFMEIFLEKFLEEWKMEG